MMLKSDDYQGFALQILAPIITDVLRAVLHDIFGLELDKAKSSKAEDAIRLQFGKAEVQKRVGKQFAQLADRFSKNRLA